MKRLWGIRHIRFAWHSFHAHRWARKWGRMGLGLGYPNWRDIDHLEAIWKGEA